MSAMTNWLLVLVNFNFSNWRNKNQRALLSPFVIPKPQTWSWKRTRIGLSLVQNSLYLIKTVNLSCFKKHELKKRKWEPQKILFSSLVVLKFLNDWVCNRPFFLPVDFLFSRSFSAKYGETIESENFCRGGEGRRGNSEAPLGISWNYFLYLVYPG